MNLTILKRIILGFVLVLLLSGNISAQHDTLSFLHITDLHVIFNLEFFQKDLAESRKHYANGIEPLTIFIETAPQKTKSNWVVATGDLIDFYEGEINNGKMMGFQTEQFVRLVDKCNVPVYLTLGNHDIISYSWHNNGRVSNQDNAEKARSVWIKNALCFVDGTYYSKNFNVEETTFQLIFLDDGYYDFTNEENIEVPYIDKAQLHWLDKQLSQTIDDIVIIIMHIPLNKARIEEGNVPELFLLLEKYSSVKLVLAGHNHKNDVQTFSFGNKNEIVQVKTGAFASNPVNWRQIKLTRDKILISQPGSNVSEKEIKF